MRNVVCAYTPQPGRKVSENDDFFNTQEDAMVNLPDQVYTFLGGDLTEQIGELRQELD